MNRNLFVCLLIVMLIGSGLYGLYRGQQQLPPAPVATPEPPPAQEEQPPAVQEPPPPPAPAEAPAPPTPEKPKRPAERPRSPEHAAVLQVAHAMQTDAEERQADVWELLEKEGKVSPEAAQTLREWAKEHPEFAVEEVGTVIAENEGGKQTRYRLVSANGGEDVLVSVSSPQKGQAAVTEAKKAPSDRTQVSAESDPITVVEGFVEALKRGDMGTARRLTAGRDVADATLAGLCMLFEEGDFSMRRSIPIRNMFRNGNNAGFLIYMSPKEGGAAQAARHIGVELLYEPEKGWAVKAVALDDLLNRYEESGAAEGGVYFPIVKNPQGGDSLALYFSFNDATLSPRSVSQIKIVANLLRESQGSLNISGHTDDVGTAEYNRELSLRRAEAVKAALVEYGVDADKISTHGMGKSQPRRAYKAGDSAQTIRTIRGENRRAEIYLDF